MTSPRGDRPESGFSPRAMAAVVVCVTLIAGILVGIGLDRAFFRPRHGPFGPFAFMHDGPNADSVRTRMRAEFARQLNLTPDQQARIDTIMQRRMAVLDSIRKTTMPQIRTLIGATQAQIDSVLTPEQRVQFQSLRQHRRGRRFRPDSGGPRP
ncbi:MAG TPA: hypothetical protein VGR59_08135 [Gemmatimonadaceae bacterium]|nr:hypothetical protein [Gemmatimonadaceae bacterium]